MAIIEMENEVMEVYERLFARYGDLKWWPAVSTFEMMVGAVLTQNTSWQNVEKAIANFNGIPTPQGIEEMDLALLSDIIRPARYYNQKALYLKALTEWYKQYGYSVESVQEKSMPELRRELLAVRGVGAETADCILLYAFGFPSFVVDAYTKRLLERLDFDGGKSYDQIKAYYESRLPREAALYNNYHACIVINAKEYCQAKPVCGGCPLRDICCYA